MVPRVVIAVGLALALLAAQAAQVTAQTFDGDLPLPAGQQGSDLVGGVSEGLVGDSLGPDTPPVSEPGEGSAAAEVAFPALGSQLSALAVAHAEGSGLAVEPGSGDAARDPALPGGANSTSGGGPLLLMIQLDSNRADVLGFLAKNGVTPSNVVGDYLEVYVPPELLGPLAQQTGVSRVREVPQSFKSQSYADGGRVFTDAARSHGALPWHFDGFTGDGVKVGVIDGSSAATTRDGFTGVRALLGTELPLTVIGRCYIDVGQPTSDLANCDSAGGNGHGTQVAESLMHVAPDADLYIANPKTWADLHSSVVWMHSQGVDVIAYAMGWGYHGAADGTSPITPSPLNTAKWAADNGILWVNSAGNEHKIAWLGAFADSDDDGYHEWAGTGAGGDEAQLFRLPARAMFYVEMRWDDAWGGSTRDLDLEVRYSSTADGTQTVVATSADLQNGGTTDYPRESIGMWSSKGGYYWVYAKKKAASTAPAWVQVQVFGGWGFSELDHYTAGGSVVSPADSSNPGVLAVGAADRGYGTALIESYSSRGPTPDGRTKPDIVAFDCEPISSGEMCGTSQSAPHVAGLAALVLERNPTFTAQQVADFLKTNAADHGAPGPDNTWGHGLAALPSDGLTTLDDHCATTALTGSGTVQGTWDKYCYSQRYLDFRTLTTARFYSFSLDKGRNVVIEMTSDLTTSRAGRVELRRGEDTRSGSRLHTKNSSGGKPARIETRLRAGDYTIEVRPYYASQVGSFTLSVKGVPTLVESGSQVSIAAGADVSEGEDAVFTVSANPVPSAPLTVWVDMAERGRFGVASGLHPVTISTSGSGVLTVPTVDDNADEADGSVIATLESSLRYTVSSDRSASITVGDDEDSLPLPVAGDPCVTMLTGSGSIEGAWTGACDSSVGPSGRYARFYAFTLDERTTVMIDLEGSLDGSGWPIDTFLYLRRGLGQKDGRALTRDDDGGKGRNAKIRRRLPPGEYTIEATTRGVTELSKFGKFGLTVSGLPTVGQTVPRISIAASGDVTEGGAAQFTVSASPAPSANLDVDVTVAAVGDFGVSVGSQTVTIPPSGSVTLSVATTGDDTDEPDGSVTVTVGSGADYTPASTSSATVTVADDDSGTQSGYSVDPGVLAKVRKLAARTVHGSAHVNRWRRVLIAFGEDAGAGVTGGPMTAAEARQMADTYKSPVWDEVVVELTALEAAAVVKPVVSVVAAGDVTEGSAAEFAVSASSAPSADLDVEVAVSLVGDFGAVTGSHKVTIASGTTSASMSVPTVGDSADEPDGSVTAMVRTGAGYTVSSTAGAATVAVADDDDPPPAVSIAAAGDVTEGTAAQFTVTATPAPAAGLDVSVTVTATGDFGAATGTRTVTIPTSGSATMTVATTDDSTDETDGSLTATVADGADYDLGTPSTAAVAVTDDDVPEITITADRTAITEGDNAGFTITASPAPHNSLAVTVAVAQSGDWGAAVGARTVTVGATGSVTLTVPTVNDAADEPDGAVTATVSTASSYTVGTPDAATVAVADDDDPPPEPDKDKEPQAELTVTVDDAAGTEGDVVTFRVVLSKALTEELEVSWYAGPAYHLRADQARAHSSDYWAMSGKMVFAPGTTEMTEQIWLKQDNHKEPDEHFSVEAYLPGSWRRPDATGTMTITDDD